MYSDGNSYLEILDRALSDSRFDNYDKREGSVIYNSLAPLCMEIADLYLRMDIMNEQGRLLSATGINLDWVCSNYGITRIKATTAKRKATFKKSVRTTTTVDGVEETITELVDMDIPVGSRFTIPTDGEVTYMYTGKEDGFNILECEITGTRGNVYVGNILPLQYISDLAEANIIDTVPYYPARDLETDDELRQRTLRAIQNNAFGGNVQSYIDIVGRIEGTGNVRVYPVWQGGGTVLLSIVDGRYNPISDSFKNAIKELIDPEETAGSGFGYAPIGHTVTITTPEKSFVDISMQVILQSGLEVANVKEAIDEAIEEYFDSERRKFSPDVESLTIYRARIISAVLRVDEVVNVLNVRLNGEDMDLVFEDKVIHDDTYGNVLAIKQFLPYTESSRIEVTT